jgi:hypothetical protein
MIPLLPYRDKKVVRCLCAFFSAPASSHCKTFVGLSIAKILFSETQHTCCSSDGKATDWVEDGHIARPTMINGIRDAGEDVVVTTYANFYQNGSSTDASKSLIALMNLILGQNQQGSETSYYKQHKTYAMFHLQLLRYGKR